MSNMPGNPYAERIDKAIEGGRAVIDQEVFATLALAFEQRTANLIAAAGMVGTDLTGLPDKTLLHWVDLALAINSRLGLDTK